MKAGGTLISTTWRTWKRVVAGLLFPLGMVGLARGQAPAPVLAQLVRPAPGTRPLGQVLAELARQSGQPFSYSSSLVPVAHPCYLRPGPARPLGMVLREIAAAEHLSYGLLAGQLVLWPDHLSAPVGVAAVNGGVAASPVHPASLAKPAAPAAGRGPAAVAKTAAVSGRAAGQPVVVPDATAFFKPVKRAGPPTASGKLAAKRPLTSGPAARARVRSRANLSNSLGPKVRRPRLLSVARRRTAQPLGQGALVPAPRSSRSQPRRAGPSRGTTPGLATTVATSPIGPRSLTQSPPRGPVLGRAPVALLAPLSSSPASAPAPGAAPSSVPEFAGLPGRSATAKPAPAADSVVKKPFALAGLRQSGYLHGEVGGGESLRLNATVKLGVPRIYLVLGAAIGPAGRQSSSAWGVGVGTAGRLRGRFTPSLDLLHWFVTGDREVSQNRLTQLRPTLAWQLRAGGRWQLMGGPTLNLATARREPGPRGRGRWDLGENQWLWLDASREQNSLRRLWPGLQLGLRF